MAHIHKDSFHQIETNEKEVNEEPEKFEVSSFSS